MTAKNPDPTSLSVVQQTMRSLMLALAGASKADLPTLATLLAAAAAHPDLHPDAKAMLHDLAVGASYAARMTGAEEH